MYKSTLRFCIVTFAATSVAPSGHALAQVKAETTTSDIIVTARKKEERLQDVPVAITAFSQEELAAKNVGDVRGIANTTPGLVLEQNPRSSMAVTISLRGQTARDAVITNDQSIGLYIDDVYRARIQGAVTGLFDVQQVQVLRGVQGTLFGRNNTGGAILISTVAPKYEMGAKVVGSIGNFDSTKFEGVVNVPVVADKIAVRVSAIKVNRDGVIDNLANGPDGNSRDYFGLRAQIRLNATADWETIYRFTYGDADQVPNTAIPTGPGFGSQPPSGFYQAVAGAPARDRLKAYTHSLTTTVDLGSVALKNILAYHKQNVFTISDSDGYQTALLDATLLEDQKQYTGELQLTSDIPSSPFGWILGAYYFREKGQSSAYVPAIRREGPGFAQNRAFALYGHVDYDVSDHLTIGAGLRHTSERRAVQSSLVVGGICQIAARIRRAPGVCFADGVANFRYWSWEANADYKINDHVLLYARAGQGQKAGGFNNITNEALLNPFRPEEAKDIEGGLKAEWFDKVLRTNIALYRTAYKDIQRTQVVSGPGGSPITRVDNAAKATIKGIEAEVVLHPVPAFTLSGTLGYTDAKYDRFVYAGTDVSANKFSMVPKYTYSLSADYADTIGSAGELSLHVDWSHRSRMELVVINRSGLVQTPMDQLSARISFTLNGTRGVRISAFGTNLTNRHYNVSAVELPFGYNVLYRGEPRVFGLELGIGMGGEKP
ncbi:TonB-dependent receptor [Sphingobium sp. Sx8-8]|uniref:TonB-dependent receptor n=1 Tax=Sphingobium sp. Sx8-8 TaxID=2933617 RepID=UPI001F595153|nr:TonB-dependent receptor [Sphingobium sp. Sx8-8]